jgi:hypothetical protein
MLANSTAPTVLTAPTFPLRFRCFNPQSIPSLPGCPQQCGPVAHSAALRRGACRQSGGSERLQGGGAAAAVLHFAASGLPSQCGPAAHLLAAQRPLPSQRHAPQQPARLFSPIARLPRAGRGRRLAEELATDLGRDGVVAVDAHDLAGRGKGGTRSSTHPPHTHESVDEHLLAAGGPVSQVMDGLEEAELVAKGRKRGSKRLCWARGARDRLGQAWPVKPCRNRALETQQLCWASILTK